MAVARGQLEAAAAIGRLGGGGGAEAEREKKERAPKPELPAAAPAAPGESLAEPAAVTVAAAPAGKEDAR